MHKLIISLFFFKNNFFVKSKMYSIKESTILKKNVLFLKILNLGIINFIKYIHSEVEYIQPNPQNAPKF